MVIKTKRERITVREAAKECGRNAETIRRWIWSGKLPAEKLGNQLYIKRSDLPTCQPEKRKSFLKIPVEEFIRKATQLHEEMRAYSGNIDAGNAIREARKGRLE